MINQNVIEEASKKIAEGILEILMASVPEKKDEIQNGDIISVEEAAKFFGKSKNWVYREVKRENLPYFRFEGVLFFSKPALREHVAASMRIPKQTSGCKEKEYDEQKY